MAQLVNTHDTYDSNRLREDFRDAIYSITPEETPALTLLPRETVDSRHPEWSTDELEPPEQNAQIEGDEWSWDLYVEPSRLGNYTQISRKTYRVSDTEEKVRKAGPQSELGRLRRKKGVELKKDMELGVLQNVGSHGGGSNTPRRSAGFAAWLKTNDNRGAGGSDGGFNQATGLVAAAINGTKRTFTKAILDDIVQKSYKSGGSPRTLMAPPHVKTVFSTFMSDANVAAQRAAASGERQLTIYGAADTYVSDFGTIDIMPNRVMAQDPDLARNAILMDPDMAAVGIMTGRDIHEIKSPKTGDAEGRILLVEYTLIMKNEAAHGIAADLFGISASS